MIRLIPLFILMLSSITTFSQKNSEIFGCVTYGENRNILPMMRTKSKTPNFNKEIKVVVHICYSDNIPNSYIPPEVIVGAIDQMNVDFEGTNLSFILHDYDYINLKEFPFHDGYVNGIVCFPTYKVQSTMISKKYARKTSEYCNIYVTPNLCSTTLGFAYVQYGPLNSDDGIWVESEVFGYGLWPHINPRWVENETLTHEMGHYCGLFHTFNATTQCGYHDPNIGCEYEGDYVCDTAPHKMSRGCPGVNGFFCPEIYYDGALFKSNNYMDYCPEQCRDIFTPGQIDRMHRMLEFQRYELYSESTVTPFCLGDINKDGLIGVDDMLIILSNFGCVECGYDRGDMNMDYAVTSKDLTFFLSFWGDTCGDNVGQRKLKYATEEIDPYEIIKNYHFPERGKPTKEQDRENKEEEKPTEGFMTLTKKVKTTLQIKLSELDELDLFGLFLEDGIENLIVEIGEGEKIVIERS